MSLQLVGRVIGMLGLTVAGLGCAICLYRIPRREKNRFPIITLLIIGSTALLTGLQFVFPEILTALRRDREALLAGEWWRMLTPLFVQAYGWPQACVNGVGAAVSCPIAERLFGKRMALLYFVPGILAQFFAYFWSPNAAGSSLGVAGISGGLFGFALLHRDSVTAGARRFAYCGIVAAIVLCVFRDIHGPPAIIGLALPGMTRSRFEKPAIGSSR